MALNFLGPDRVPVVFRVNGERVQVLIEPRRTLLSVLREELGLTGAKRGCGQGQCGACTVILDGETVYACMTLAIDCEGREVRTVESLAQGEDAAPRAAGLHRARRLPVWLLHAGPGHVRGGAPGAPRTLRRRMSARDERQPLPLRRLSQHPERRAGRRARTEGEG
jgi:ferredoxin